ncbi:MAG: hypothetical protein PHI24_13885 [Desulfitobacteriaceae bacterium]|nr:hypothetical protein [Desulfitobacteriaceae bacterium]
MPTLEIEFSVYCAECGEGLCNLSDVKQNSWDNKVYVAPCPRCLERAKDEGYQEGQEADHGRGKE